MAEGDHRKGESIAVVAHELRNLLAPIRSGLEILRLRGDDPPTLERMRCVMERQITDMTRLIDGLLDRACATEGDASLRPHIAALVVVEGAGENPNILTDAKHETFTQFVPAETAPAMPTAHCPGRSLRALVIDDNVNSADSLALLLQLWGHEVRVAYDGPSALTAAAALRPDIVLLDLTLPDMDGYEVADRLRQGQIGEARLVAITGRGLEADRQRSRAAGFDGHLVKPVEPAALRALFEQLSRAAKTG